MVASVVTSVIMAAATAGAASDDTTADTTAPDHEPSGDGLVSDGLARIPVEALGEGEMPMIMIADLDAATEANGVSRPTGPDDPDGLAWMGSLTGIPGDDGSIAPVFVPLPQQFVQYFEPAAFAAVFGWSILDVATIAAVEAPPVSFSVVGDGFADDTLASGLVEVTDGIVSDRDGEDFEPGLADRNPAIDAMGRPQRLAVADGHVALSTSTPAVEAWLAADTKTAGHDPRLAAVAGALDTAGVVSALLVPMTPSDALDVLGGVGATPADVAHVEAELAEVALDEPFDAVGLGWWADAAGEPRMTLAYHFADEAAAAASVPRVEALFTDGSSLVTRAPMTDLLVVEDVVADGAVVTVALSPGPEGRPQTLYQMLSQRDLPFVAIG